MRVGRRRIRGRKEWLGSASRERDLELFSKVVNEKVTFSFAGEKRVGMNQWPDRKLKGTRVELNRREAFGYAF
jgi:hypothetical protein